MIIPIGDRIICTKLEVPEDRASPILSAFSERQDSQNSAIRLEVLAVSELVKKNGNIKTGDVVIVGRHALINMLRTRIVDGADAYIMHEEDLDGIEYE